MMRFTSVVALFPTCRRRNLCRGWNAAGSGPRAPARLGIPRDRRRPRPADPRLCAVRMAVARIPCPLVLSLLDQIYTLRGQMRAIARAVEGQPEAVRDAILAALRG